ncbi:helix-turn-helix transcriptional regulator [Mucilaginibacter antarcticus]|uniref:Response regulator transcription factor n=1 Tax=Mucilaginibacter antarcticus TaxID=1855725 RepID=A0ABW5XR34_9SPHI
MRIQAAIRRHKQTILYGLAMGVLWFLLQWLELRFVLISHAFEIYAGTIALVFTGLGIWLATKLIKPKVTTVVVEKQVFVATGPGFTLNEAVLEELRISKRELDVLQLMADGLSSQQIAERLFVSLNTVKTHTSNLFMKLDAGRRTLAIEKAKRLNLIP